MSIFFFLLISFVLFMCSCRLSCLDDNRCYVASIILCAFSEIIAVVAVLELLVGILT